MDNISHPETNTGTLPHHIMSDTPSFQTPNREIGGPLQIADNLTHCDRPKLERMQKKLFRSRISHEIAKVSYREICVLLLSLIFQQFEDCETCPGRNYEVNFPQDV